MRWRMLWLITICFAFLASCAIGCASPGTVVLPDSEVLHSVPAGHCQDCHAQYYDGRVIIDKGYLLRLFERVK